MGPSEHDLLRALACATGVTSSAPVLDLFEMELLEVRVVYEDDTETETASVLTELAREAIRKAVGEDTRDLGQRYADGVVNREETT